MPEHGSFSQPLHEKTMNLVEHPLVIIDGACGTNLQDMPIPAEAWEGREGCNEILNLNSPEVIVELHRRFVEAGAMVLETDTFGANRVVLTEYGLQDRVAAINRAAVQNARKAIGNKPDVYVAASIGPGSKLPTLGHIEVDELAGAYREQMSALLEAGVDLFIIETCQDLLQTKTALVACFAVQELLGKTVPVMVSVTMEKSGTMLLGTDIAAACATFAPFPLFAFGLNCATGPADMESHIRYLCQNWPGRVSCVPNQGLPEIVEGKTCYPLAPDEYAQEMRRFVNEYGVSVVGGCCGTTPTHIKALVAAMQGAKPKKREAGA